MLAAPSCRPAAARTASNCPPDFGQSIPPVLPVQFRLQRAGDFTATVKKGSRAARPHLVVHLVLADSAVTSAGATIPPRAGFVVSKAVGGSVTRHAVVRRLRPLVAARLSPLPAGTRVVVRALPAAAAATSQSLDRDLDSAFTKALAKELAKELAREPAGSGALL